MAERTIRVTLEAAISSYRSNMRTAGQDTKALGNQLEQTSSRSGKSFNLMGVAAAAGAAIIVRAYQKAIDTGAKYAGTIRGLQAVTGGTAEDTSRLAFVLERVGIDADGAQRPLAILSKNIEQGGKNFKQYFTAAEIARMRSQGLIETLPVLAQKYQQLATTTERNTFLQNVFGRGGLEMRKLLNLTAGDIARLSSEAEKFGLVLTQKNLAAFKEYTESTRAMGQASKGLQVQVGLLTAPVMLKFNEIMTGLLNTLATAPGFIKTAAGAMGLLGTGLFAGAQSIEAAINIIGAGVRGLSAVPRTVRSVGNAVEAAAATAIVGQIGWKGFAATSETVALGSRAAAAGIGLVGGALAALGIGVAVAGVALLTKHFIDLRNEADKTADVIAGTGPPQEQLNNLHKEIELRRKVVEAQRAARRSVSSDPSDPLSGAIGEGIGSLFSKQDRELSALESRAKQLRQNIIEAGEGTGRDRAESIKRERDELEALTGTISSQLRLVSQQAQAYSDLERALTESTSSSEAGTDAISLYAQELTNAQVAAANSELSEEQLAKVRSESAAAALKAAAEIEEAQLKAAAASDEAAAKQIESNEKLILSFDLFSDKAKEGLGKLEEVLKENTKDVPRFYEDLNNIFAAGFPGLAKSLLDMGPEAAKAARQAAERIGSKEGLGSLEEIAVAALIATKASADTELDKWQINFEGKGRLAKEKLIDALATAPEELQAAVGEPVVVNVDTSKFDPVLASRVESLNKFGLLAPLARLQADGSQAAKQILATELKALGLTQKDWKVIFEATHRGLPAVEAALNAAAAKKRTSWIDVYERFHGGRRPGQPYKGAFANAERDHDGGPVLHGGGPVLGRKMHDGGELAWDDVPLIGQRGEYMSDKQTVSYWGGAPFFAALKAAARMHDGGFLASSMSARPSAASTGLLQVAGIDGLRSDIRSLGDRIAQMEFKVGQERIGVVVDRSQRAYQRSR